MGKNKRTNEEELARCHKRLKRLEKKLKDRSKTSDPKDRDKNQDDVSSEEGGGTSQLPEADAPENPGVDPPENPLVDPPENPGADDNPKNDTSATTEQSERDKTEVIDPDVLLILGDPAEEVKKFGPDISENLANRWMPILKKGLGKDEKENINKQYQVPSNCALLQSPGLNPEISSAISDAAKNRDKKLEAAQQQLGVGLTALGRAMSLAITDYENEKMLIIKHMNNAARILADLHFNETRGRKLLITPILDKNFLDLVKDVDHDELLYGKNLSENIKTLKSIERSSQSIKKPEQPKGTAHAYSSSSKQKQGNFNNPPRYQQRFTPSFRGTARGGFKRPPLPPRRPAPTPAPAQTKKDTPRASR